MTNRGSWMVRLRSPQVADRGSRASFTLIELLLVMFIIVILTGAMASSVSYINRKAAEARTQATLAKIAAALEAYNADWGMYPLADSNNWNGVTSTRLDASTNFNTYLLTNLAGLGPGMKRYLSWSADETNVNYLGGGSVVFGVTVPNLYIVDGFGTPIAYDPNSNSTNTAARGLFPNGRVNFTSYDLWSFGADMQSVNVDTMRDDIKNWE